MADEPDWSLATWEGNRRRQHQEYLALSFREKLERLEHLELFAATIRLGKQAEPGLVVKLKGGGQGPTIV